MIKAISLIFNFSPLIGFLTRIFGYIIGWLGKVFPWLSSFALQFSLSNAISLATFLALKSTMVFFIGLVVTIFISFIYILIEIYNKLHFLFNYVQSSSSGVGDTNLQCFWYFLDQLQIIQAFNDTLPFFTLVISTYFLRVLYLGARSAHKDILETAYNAANFGIKR